MSRFARLQPRPLAWLLTPLLVLLALAAQTALPASAQPTTLYDEWAAESIVRGEEITQERYVEHVIRVTWEAAGAPADQAMRVARCESLLVPTAVNGQYRGLFQLGNYHRHRAAARGYSWDDMFRIEPNVHVALDLYLEAGWVPWSCRP